MVLITQKILQTKELKNVSFAILMLNICFVFGQKTIIVVDAGHGGKDYGAIGKNGEREKDVVLKIAKEINSLNTQLLNNKYDIYLTRNTDTLISLRDRTRLANTLKADIFISIHNNASPKHAQGMEVYVHNISNGHHRKSILLGQYIIREFTQKLGFKIRGVKFANFQVLRETRTLCPAILVETGFLTDLDESDYLSVQNNRRALALAILIGITNYTNEL
ncbi:N-acetylmuramoyl-L-alanine amidase family protein [Flavivirga jejuensis]|uniref:N-acetylmuramoyl-L-alanine amidase n=1 Tax=Flavivirga jejuensis TaxID=870487 RepID=A0ABT8WVS0_9FLAO|nr:N-acetylmuramoyl-L-alanine amidase [Flavivirga jejuensis]MDO5977109.1 N-acetylmuramoyl-L-alanine amidase [Flavivirga jejuensis]